MVETRLQPNRQVPETDGEKREHYGAPDELEIIPEARLEHSHKEGGKKKGDGREDSLLESECFSTFGFNQAINHAVKPRLDGHPAKTLRVWIIGAEDRAVKLAARPLFQLRIVVSALLWVA